MVKVDCIGLKSIRSLSFNIGFKHSSAFLSMVVGLVKAMDQAPPRCIAPKRLCTIQCRFVECIALLH